EAKVIAEFPHEPLAVGGEIRGNRGIHDNETNSPAGLPGPPRNPPGMDRTRRYGQGFFLSLSRRPLRRLPTGFELVAGAALVVGRGAGALVVVVARGAAFVAGAAVRTVFVPVAEAGAAD